ncbi:MAG: hypothetical protein ABI221_01195 [Candidatus Saccharimonadales bacterium]
MAVAETVLIDEVTMTTPTQEARFRVYPEGPRQDPVAAVNDFLAERPDGGRSSHATRAELHDLTKPVATELGTILMKQLFLDCHGPGVELHALTTLSAISD